MMLAEMSATSEWVMSLSTLGCFVTSVVMMIAVLVNKSQKREITLSPEALTRREFEEARKIRDEELKRVMEALEKHADVNRTEHDGIFKKIGGVERGAQERLDTAMLHVDQSIEKVHNRVNDVLKAVGKLEGKVERTK